VLRATNLATSRDGLLATTKGPGAQRGARVPQNLFQILASVVSLVVAHTFGQYCYASVGF